MKLTYLGLVKHLWVNKPNTIGSNNGLSSDRHQAIIWTSAKIIIDKNWTVSNNLQWNLNRNLYILVKENAFENVGKWRPFYIGLNVFIIAGCCCWHQPPCTLSHRDAITTKKVLMALPGFRRALDQHRGVNTLRPRQDGRHFPDDIFKCIFLNENVLISIKISLKFVSKGPMNNIPALVQIMAWRRTGDKPLSEPMTTQFNDAYMRHLGSMS